MREGFIDMREGFINKSITLTAFLLLALILLGLGNAYYVLFNPKLKTNTIIVQEPEISLPLNKRGVKTLPVHTKDIPINQTTEKTAQKLALFDNEDFIRKLESPYGFAIDNIHGRVIWTNSVQATFMVTDFDGRDLSPIPTNFEAPFQIENSTPFGRNITFYSEGALRRIDYDTQLGTETSTVLIRLDDHKIHGLAYDELNSAYYLGNEFGQAKYAITLPIDEEHAVATELTPVNP